MTRRKLFASVLFCSVFAISLSTPSVSLAQDKAPPLKLGMVNAFFSDLPPAIIDVATGPFAKLMKDTTGLDGALTYRADALGTAAQLEANQLQFGVFHGHEFAWIQKTNPKLKALMVVANKQHNVQAFVIVKKDSPAKDLTDLRGKTVDFPCQTKEHCRVFVNKYCCDNNRKPIFKQTLKTESCFVGLDEVCQGKADAVVVDSIMLSFYKEIKGPTFDRHLRILGASDPFPPAVIVYKEGGIKEATVKQFRDGLLKAHLNPEGADMMKMWSIDGFELPPADFQKLLDRSLKAYPAPR